MIMGLKGASTLTICFIVAKFINNVVLAGLFDQWIGKVKLLVASAVSVVVSALGMFVDGQYSFSQIIIACIGLTAMQVFIDQAQKQWFTKKGSV